jgi:hypothetical protein
MMTLGQWIQTANYPYTGRWNGHAYVIADCAGNPPARRSLWNLSDYRVSSVCGGSIWLMPKEGK